MISKKGGIVLGAILIAAALTWLAVEGPSGKSLGPFSVNKSQNPYLTEFSLPSGSAPNGLVVDRAGTVWVASSKSQVLYSFEPVEEKLGSYMIEENGQRPSVAQNTTMVWSVVQSKDGTIWFSPLGSGVIWRFNPANGTFHSIRSETGSAFQMKADGEGDIWYTTLSGNTLCVIQADPSSQSGYRITSFNLGNGTGPAGLFLQGNNVWVTEITSQKIAKFMIGRQDGLVTGITKLAEFPPDQKTQLSSPTDLVVDNDTVWLTEHGTSFLTRYDTGTGAVDRYPTSQNQYHATTLPFWIRPVGNGDLWFNEHEGNKLAFFDQQNKTMIEYDIPSRPKDGFLTYPLNIATDPSDRMVLWFSEWNTDKLGRIDGHAKVPFSLSSDTNTVMLSPDASKATAIDITVTGQSPYSSNRIYLNASSSMVPAAGFGNVDVSFKPDLVDLSNENHSQLILRNYSAPPGNYTLAVSASNGAVTKTIFLNLVIPK